jgi:hypothetical protein
MTRWTAANQPERGQPAPLVAVQCAEPGCTQTTHVAAPHADKLRGVFRCREHYLGAWSR